ncbi:MAG: class I SAM-dependent methyltransferase [Candidatus Moranbacteria bacterium]|nr:class I SAM-dependent methyltransferase [Candidatus Moranbacteria bacterium]
MKQKNDAFGQEVMSYYKTGEGYEIVEKDDGFIGIGGYGPVGYFSEYKNWPKHEKEAIKFAKGKVLDIGCGAGRVALFLQNKGLEATGIDNSPLAIKVCKLRGLERVKVLSINQINKFKPNSFDTIIMFGNNFGLFSSLKKAKSLLKKMQGITSDNALIITESKDPYITDESSFREYHERNKKLGRIPGQMRLRVRFKNYIGDWFDYLMVSKNEMKEILKGTGWKVTKFIDHEDKTKGVYIAIIEKLSKQG